MPKTIEFTCSTILKGNPVKGILISEDEEYLTVYLEHRVETNREFWNENEEKFFLKSMITSDVKVTGEHKY